MTVVGTPETALSTEVTVVVQGRAERMLIDTGAEQSVLSTSAATALGLAGTGPPQKVNSVGCTSTARTARIDAWSLDGHDLPSTLVSLESLPGTGEGAVAGLLGADVLSSFGSITLDFTDKALVLGGSPPSGGRTVAMGVEVGGQMVPAVAIQAAGVSTNWLMDTGAETTGVDSATAEKLGFEKVGTAVQLGTPGCTTSAQPVRIRSWSIDGIRLPATDAVSNPSPLTSGSQNQIVGEVGENVMASFGSVTFDFDGGRLTLG